MEDSAWLETLTDLDHMEMDGPEAGATAGTLVNGAAVDADFDDAVDDAIAGDRRDEHRAAEAEDRPLAVRTDVFLCMV